MLCGKTSIELLWRYFLDIKSKQLSPLARLRPPPTTGRSRPPPRPPPATRLPSWTRLPSALRLRTTLRKPRNTSQNKHRKINSHESMFYNPHNMQNITTFTTTLCMVLRGNNRTYRYVYRSKSQTI